MARTSETPTGTCPHCGKPVDPLRAGAVSVIGGRIAHFCGMECREAHLKAEREARLGHAEAREEAPSEEPPAEEEEPAEEGAPEERERRPPPARGARSAQAKSALVSAVAVAAALAGVLLLPVEPVHGLLPLGAAALAVVGRLGIGIYRQRRAGPARVIEAAAVPAAAAALVAVTAFGAEIRWPATAAVALLLAEQIGRLLEIAARWRSGVLEVVEGTPPLLLASEWRDNSAVAERIRRITLVLEWAQFPLAAALGLAAWLFLSGSPADGLLAGATVLVCVNPRALRMATGDAHLSVALAAARRGIVIRDAHAVDRVGSVRVVLFMPRRVLLDERAAVAGWRAFEGEDEGAVLSALGGLEASVEGRIAAAIREHVASRGAVPADVEGVRVEPGLGVVGSATIGPVMCGSRGLLLGRGVSTAEREEWAADFEKTGRRALFAAVDDRVAAVFAVEEDPLPDAVESVRRLSSAGLEPAMTTSAELEPGAALGARLGIDNVRFLTPEEKVSEAVSDIVGAGDRVLLVGNGEHFEQSLRSATAAVSLGSTEPTMAGVDARGCTVAEVPWICEAAAEARRSVSANLVAAVGSAMVGLSLSLSWHSPAIVLVVGALGFLSAALATLNRPYPIADRIASWTGRALRRAMALAGLRR